MTKNDPDQRSALCVAACSGIPSDHLTPKIVLKLSTYLGQLRTERDQWRTMAQINQEAITAMSEAGARIGLFAGSLTADRMAREIEFLRAVRDTQASLLRKAQNVRSSKKKEAADVPKV